MVRNTLRATSARACAASSGWRLRPSILKSEQRKPVSSECSDRCTRDGADAQLLRRAREIARLHERQEDLELSEGDLFVDSDVHVGAGA